MTRPAILKKQENTEYFFEAVGCQSSIPFIHVIYHRDLEPVSHGSVVHLPFDRLVR